MSVRIGDAVIYCKVRQVAAVRRQLTSQDGAQWSRPKIAEAAVALVTFEEETHKYMADNMEGPITDMRHGTQMLRKHVLDTVLKGEERNLLLAHLKFLDRITVTSGEVRHHSAGSLTAAATATVATIATLNGADPKVRTETELEE